MEGSQGSGDDTALNAIKVLKCPTPVPKILDPLPSPQPSPQPVLKYEMK